jgi:hypothetical protein
MRFRSLNRSLTRHEMQPKYVKRNYYGVFARILPLTFADDTSDIVVWVAGDSQGSLGIHTPVTRTETHVGLYVQCASLLYDFSQNLNASTNFSETLQYQISCKSVQAYGGVIC